MQSSAPATARDVAEEILTNDATRRSLVAYAYTRYSIGADDAGDILQETVLELLRYRTYIHSPKGFVFTVFQGRCRRFIGGIVASRRVFESSSADVEAHADPLGADEFDQQVALRQALRLISSNCVRLLSAYYVEGVDLKEAAERLELASSSASKTLSRCLKKLRECLA